MGDPHGESPLLSLAETQPVTNKAPTAML
ncbi:hypothetical protein CCP4SC76_5360002 [Gammaproteobacteria bacterium]